MDGKFVGYLRVSTSRQGQSGLGLDAQRDAVQQHLNGGDWRLLGEYVEVESGAKDARPQLEKALEHCRLTGATLVVAKLDRLSRNQSFLMSVYEGTGDAGVVFCDLPRVPPGPVGKFLVQQMAAVAELEAGLISQRTKAALAQSTKKLGGYKGGKKADHHLATAARMRAADAFATSLAPTMTELRSKGLNLSQIARELASKGIRTPKGGQWSAASVGNLLVRIARIKAA